MSLSILQSVRKPDETVGPRQRPQRGWTGAGRLSALMPGLSLSARFAFAAAIVLCNSMALLGGWVVIQIERGLSQNAAISDSAYVQSLLSPIVPLLADRDAVVSEIAVGVDRRLQSTPLIGRLTSMEIWLPDGTIAYSTGQQRTGRKLALPHEVQDGFNDEVRTTLSEKHMRMLHPDKPDGVALRKVYAPLHDETAARKVVAVVEIVTNADALEMQMDSIRKRTWLVVGLTTLLMLGVLFVIVQSGSQTIEEQRLEIERRLEEEIRLGKVNQALRERLQEANRRGIELGEEQLRRISSELENGPVQLLALALLRMYELKPETGGTKSPHGVTDVVDVISGATEGALKEIREISSGLLLPELQRISARDAVERAIRAHEQTTGTAVARSLGPLPAQLPIPVTICLFRVVQEGLMNAHSHAGARGQAVTGSADEESVAVTVSDEGPGISAEDAVKPGSHLGLRWLRQRVESIGGTLTIRSGPGKGTQLTARFPLRAPA